MALSVRIHPLHPNGSQRVEIAGRLDTHTYGELDDRLTLVLASVWASQRGEAVA